MEHGETPPSPGPISRRNIVVYGVLFELALAGAAWLVGWLVGQPPARTLRWRPLDVLWGMLAAVPMLAVFFASRRWLVQLRELVDEIMRLLFASCRLFDLAVIAIAAGIGEELLFRGVIQPALEAPLGVAGALVVSNLLFGLLHPLSRVYVLLAALLGLILGGLWLWTGNLLAPVIAHALYDFLALAYLMRKRPADHSRSPVGSSIQLP